MIELILLLAQTCVAEIDLQDKPVECVVMWEINARNADRRGRTLAEQTRAFNAYWKNTHNGRRWIAELDTAPEPPEHWPSRRNWERERPKWDQYLEAAERFVIERFKGTYTPVCRAANSYGGIPDDGKHADDPAPCARAERVSCLEGERQAYWNTKPCRIKGRRGRPIPADVAAGVTRSKRENKAVVDTARRRELRTRRRN